MSAELNIKNPGKLEATISFTFTLEQWVEVQKALKDTPHYGVTGVIKEAINDLATKACKTFHYFPEPAE